MIQDLIAVASFKDHVLALIIVAFTAMIATYRRQEKPFHVKYEAPKYPLALRFIANLPFFIRKRLLLAEFAPKVPLDAVDFGITEKDEQLYDIKEIEPDKIWRVRYTYPRDPNLVKMLASICGVDLEDESLLLQIECKKMRDTVAREMKMTQDSDMDCSKDKARHFCSHGCNFTQDMLVARLNDDENGLLLFNPCRIHPSIGKFLNELGNVKYIVSGSSAHTNQLKQVWDKYPDAMMVCAEAADVKCQSIGMRPATFLYTRHDNTDKSFNCLKKELNGVGVDAYHVVGDAVTQALVLVCHNHLFEVDLLYGNGNRLALTDQSAWDDPNARDINFWKWFYYGSIHSSVIPGFLPNYRIMGQDPSSLLAKLNLDPPNESSCKIMADSLREMLKLQFDYVDSAHNLAEGSLRATTFRNIINKTWSWLDGQSLLHFDDKLLKEEFKLHNGANGMTLEQ